MSANSPNRIISYLLSPCFLTCLAVGLFGCLAIYNATYHTGAPFFFVGRQIVWLGIGIITLYCCIHIPLSAYERWVLPVSGVMLILLYALLVSGTRINGMRGWFTIDAGSSGTFFIQPSEFGKPIFILFLAKLAISGSHRTTISCKSYLKYLLFASLWFVPILLQPDYGTLLLYVTGFAMLYWLQGGQIVHLLVTIIAGIPLLAYVFYRHPYLQDRISGFLNPIAHAQDSGWHVLQLKNALASGGAWGRSFGNTLWSRNYLPLGHNDSIFATLAESIGFTGVAPIIFGVFVWFVYCIYVAKQQQFFHHALVVSGIAIMLAVQAFIHISITLGLFPPTGITLPMFSYGGSSLVSTMASIGVILSIAYKDTKNELQL